MKKLFLLLLTVAIFYPTTFSFARKNTTVNIATFNLRLDTENDKLNAWKYRKEMVKDLIRFYEFDIFGTQEGFKHQLDDIKELSYLDYIGGGREDGKDAGEHSAIFYNKKKFKVLKNGDFWFAENPEIPNKGWDATCCKRICSWAQFKDLKTKKTFYVFNVHYDHQGKEARRNSSILLLHKINEIAKNSTVFCTGDFNANPTDEPIQIIYNANKLRDSFLHSAIAPYGTEATFHNYNIDYNKKERIDYIWISDDVTVNKYGTLNDNLHGRFPSDHFPVMINATF